MAKKPKHCPNCKTGTLIPFQQTRVLVENPAPGSILFHAAVSIAVPAEVCAYCHECFTGPAATKEEERVRKALAEFVHTINSK